jgi:group II intron reverse transcriptase/maturase
MEPLRGTMTKTKGLNYFSPGLQRVARQARDHPEWRFTTLAHHIDIDLMREAYRHTRKDGAVGVDGETAADFEVDLESNLRTLLEEAKSGRYRAPAVRRTYIPKGDGRQRPLGIPTYADKVLQRAVVMALEPLYEQDFMDCSYGFRRQRSAHDALGALREGVMRMGGGYVIEGDIQDYFGAIPHAQLREVLSQRMRDGVLTRLIGKWLNAGVQEDGSISRPTSGTPQGGVISPILANVYLHEVLDAWLEHTVRPGLRGSMELVRYADDFVIVFQNRRDAEQVYEALPRRFATYGLTLHPEKTKLLDFCSPRGGSRPKSFDFLGFTHYWARSRRGYWVVKRKTAKSRLRRALRDIHTWCRTHRHLPVRDQHETLCRKLRGHCNYYGITSNSPALARFRHGVLKSWRKWLMRRSDAAARKPWSWWDNLLQHYPLPPAIAYHSLYHPS